MNGKITTTDSELLCNIHTHVCVCIYSKINIPTRLNRSYPAGINTFHHEHIQTTQLTTTEL